jgi:hypothetical protein
MLSAQAEVLYPITSRFPRRVRQLDSVDTIPWLRQLPLQSPLVPMETILLVPEDHRHL